MPFRRLENFLGRFAETLTRPPASSDRAGKVLKKIFPSSRFSAEIKKRTLLISASASLQSEVFLRREEILEKLKDELGSRAPREISFRIS